MIAIQNRPRRQIFFQSYGAALNDQGVGFIAFNSFNAVTECGLQFSSAIYHFAPRLGIHGEMVVGAGPAVIVGKVFFDDPRAHGHGTQNRSMAKRVVGKPQYQVGPFFRKSPQDPQINVFEIFNIAGEIGRASCRERV